MLERVALPGSARLGGAAGCIAGLWLPGSPGVWAMIGMAGIMSGAMRAPLTGALFAAELTGRFDARPAVIAAAGFAYAISVLCMRRSILTEKIARRGRHILQEYTVDTLDLQQAAGIMTPNPATLPADMTIASALLFFTQEAIHRSYPVVDVEVSSASHPFRTGRGRVVDTEGRVARFNRRYGHASPGTRGKRK